ncbi:sugar transferase [Aporhodopirellula aestuarii]|uniref:Sugar transferase n=1 Tax=Aporhodopirellula aestuarii TaxID=2950107 RepID=A0ABT0UD53_9BACT|nr:sugar transferase [Aporhodopirellula aestuarii]MCM2374823.1 sugar transferase [Aporhodopirellula aestuarii]
MSHTYSGPIIFDPPIKPGQLQNAYLHPPQGSGSQNRTQSIFGLAAADPGKDGLRSLRIDAASDSRSSFATPSPYFRVKSLIEFIVTAGLMIVAVPIMILIAALTLISQGRPVFYRQTRVGKNGKLFRIWKFRSMRSDAEKETGAVWSDRNDPRVTTLGKWLRCSHLDELPQLINILAGDMSLVGPRPERPEFVNELSRELPTYLERLRVRPGITGLAQLGLGYDRCVCDVKGKIELDIKYINSATFFNDCRLFLQTFPHVISMLLKKWDRDHSETQPVSHRTLTSCKTLAPQSTADSRDVHASKPSRSLAG